MKQENLYIVALCRPGFESEAVQELTHGAEALGLGGYAKTRAGAGWLSFHLYSDEDTLNYYRTLFVDELIFSRQLFLAFSELNAMNTADRVSDICSVIEPWFQASGRRFDGFLMESADTNEGNSLSALLRKLEKPLQKQLEKSECMVESASFRLHLLFLSGDHCLIGFAEKGRDCPLAGGILRLRTPKSAPSRSTLKLEEAFKVFLNDEEEQRWFGLGKTGVDLGACPGGWTYQLVRRQMQVFAIDNGAMDPGLMATGQVEHLKVDGFRYRPPFTVDWLICDMVEKPSRIASLMAQWLADGDARRAMFNLKLPMKKRYHEVLFCFEIIQDILADAGVDFEIRAKQLYHDREEITVFLNRIESDR